jgi:chaperonin GroEL
VDDAIHATKAALKEGVIPGGGVALKNAAEKINASSNPGELVLQKAIQAPFYTILSNAHVVEIPELKKGYGIDVVSGNKVNMIKAGIVDPVLVTKSALKNAISVVKTIISADCIISNKRA